MSIIGTGQSLVLGVLGFAALVVEVFALVEAIRFRRDAYPAAGKRTKALWVTVTAVATALGFVTVGNVLSIFGIVAVAAAIVFLVSARPALRAVSGRGGRGSQGPYGGW